MLYLDIQSSDWVPIQLEENSSQRKRTRTSDEHANFSEKGPGQRHLGIKPKPFLLRADGAPWHSVVIDVM